MSLSHQTVMFDVHDAAVAPLLTDPKDRLPTYGPLVDVPGISEVGLDPNFVTAELKGDARVIAKKGRIDRMNFSGTYAKLDLDVQAVIYGTSVSDLAASAAVVVSAVEVTEDSAIIEKTASSFTQAMVDRPASGTGIPDGTRVIYVNADGSEATLSAPATATGASVSVTIGATVEKVRSRIMSPASLPYFKIAFKISDVDEGLGDLHIVCYKCQVTGGTQVGSSSDNFGQPSFDAEAIALTGHLPDGVGGFDSGVIVDTDLFAAETALS